MKSRVLALAPVLVLMAANAANAAVAGSAGADNMNGWLASFAGKLFVAMLIISGVCLWAVPQ